MHNRRVLGQRRARIAILATRFAHLLQRRGRYQTVAARADQVLFAHLFQRLADQRPVGRIVVAQQRFVQTTLFIPFRHHHVFTLIANLTQRVLAGVVHGRRVGER